MLKVLGANQTEVETATGVWLYSYNTLVAGRVYGVGPVKCNQYSRTTAKHISQWLGKGVGEDVSKERLLELFDGAPLSNEPETEERKIEL